jgi:hypothetical protein
MKWNEKEGNILTSSEELNRNWVAHVEDENDPLRKFYHKILYWCSKTLQNLIQVLNLLKNFTQSSYKRLLAKTGRNYMYFSPFSTAYKSSQPSNFSNANFFATTSTDSNSASNSNWYPYQIYLKQIFLGLFANFKPKVQKGSKNVKCVLKFNFAFISGSDICIIPE